METQAPTFEEIRAILKEIAISQQASDRKREEADRKHEEARQEANRRQEEIDRLMQASREEANRRREEIDRQMQETDRRIKALASELNGISKSNGDFAEEYFNNAFNNDSLIFAGMHYDYMKQDLNLSNPVSGKRDEQYDIVLYNDKSIAIIEIKYKACKNDIYDIIRKADAFRGWFPEYADHKIYLGLAGMSFLKNTVNNAKDRGIAIIRQKGGKTFVNDKNLKAY